MTILIPAPAPPVIAPSQILTGAIYLMQARGRAYGNYDNRTGELCVLGGLAVAAGKEPDCWESLRGAYPHWLEPGDAELIEAARVLLRVACPTEDGEEMPAEILVEDLIERVGGWHDGTLDSESDQPIPPANSAVFAALTAAAEIAEPVLAVAV